MENLLFLGVPILKLITEVIFICVIKVFSELKIRGSTNDNPKIIFLFLYKNICCDPSLEPSH